MTRIEIYGRPGCRYCDLARDYCRRNKWPFVYRDILQDTERAELMQRYPEAATVPQIFIGRDLIGGYAELIDAPVFFIQQKIGE